jgi:DNA recombination protein RmuC
MVEILCLIAGLIVGAAVASALMANRSSRRAAESAALAAQVEARDARIAELQAALAQREEALRAAAEARTAQEARLAGLSAAMEAARAQNEEKLALLNDSRAKFEETFKALAGETLKANSAEFVRLARAHLETLVAQEDGNLEKRRESIEKVLQPLADSLQRYQEGLQALNKTNAELGQQASLLRDGQDKIQREAGNLAGALRSSQAVGLWGEMNLRRVVESAGMTPGRDFSEQVSVEGETGAKLRPDLVVHLPAGGDIVVDSKVSLSAYLEAHDAGDENERREKLKEHARRVRAHMEELASKEYARQFDRAPEFTVLFIPGDAFFSAAIEADPALFEDAIQRGVMLATPTTLIPLLITVAHGWRQAEIEENARKISQEGQRLYERAAKVFEHLDEVGAQLGRALESYNKAVLSIKARLLPSARKLKELGATTAPQITPPEPQEGSPRPLGLSDQLRPEA